MKVHYRWCYVYIANAITVYTYMSSVVRSDIFFEQFDADLHFNTVPLPLIGCDDMIGLWCSDGEKGRHWWWLYNMAYVFINSQCVLYICTFILYYCILYLSANVPYYCDHHRFPAAPPFFPALLPFQRSTDSNIKINSLIRPWLIGIWT